MTAGEWAWMIRRYPSSYRWASLAPILLQPGLGCLAWNEDRMVVSTPSSA
jgi:hypothetical protein